MNPSHDLLSESSTPPRRWLGLAGWIGISLLTGAVGGLASINATEFYLQLDRPPWAPPGWLFGPVWTVLYLLMGVAAWLVWRARGWDGARGALTLFVVQLAVNALWTWAFFAWRSGALALADIGLLAILIIATMVAFARVNRVAALLLLPYLCWVAFATALTISVWQRNPTLL
ncbi:MAG: TspO/MBR family protein [Gemmatimonadota bacterium]